MVLLKSDRLLEKIEDIADSFYVVPMKPADLVVLAVGVVIPPCVRMNSSPPRIIGVPEEKSRWQT